MMFLIHDKMETSSFQALTALGMAGVYGFMLMRFRPGGLDVVGWDVAN